MSLKMISVQCPDCGAKLEIEEGRSQAFCTYCGAKVIIQNDNEVVFRTIDEAELKKAETERLIKLKELELLEKDKEDIKAKRAIKIKLSIILGVIAGIIFVFAIIIDLIKGHNASEAIFFFGAIPVCGIGLIWYAESFVKSIKERSVEIKKNPPVKYVQVPVSLIDYQDLSYKMVQATLIRAGFENVNCIGLKDLGLIHIKKPYSIASITINGVSSNIAGKKFRADSNIVISYHSYADLSKTK